ncbi:MAG: quinolinate synthase NadA, partial [Thermodesulfovibrionales bacterium]
MEDIEKLRQRISDLKRQRNAIILSHNYQREEVQEVADFVGDSLELSQQASR